MARLDRLPIPQIRRMERLGWAIDREYFYNLSIEFGRKMVEHQANIASYIPIDRLEEFTAKSAAIEEEQGDATLNAASADQIRKLLFDVLGIGAGKPMKMTKDGSRISTGKKQLELIREDHPVVGEVLAYREYSKLKNTYSDTLPKIARFHPRGEDCPQCGLWHEQETWRVHGEIATTRTDTGRKAHRRPNLGNVPARTKNGAKIRYGFIASPGRSGRKRMKGERRTVLVSTDFSQIELRGLAHCANAKSMIEVYQDGKDIHVFTACAAFGKDYDRYARLMEADKKTLSEADKKDLDDFKLYCRLPSKNLNFMIVYGATVIGLLAQLALSGLFWTEDEGNAFIARWFGLYSEVRDYMDLQAYRNRRYGMSWDLFGRIRRVPEVRSCHSWIKAAGLRQGGNMPIQSLSAGQMNLVMGSTEELMVSLMEQEGIWCWPLMSIHDELDDEVEEDHAQLFVELKQELFNRVMEDQQTGEHRFRVPVGCGSSVMERWAKD